jgi:hypothetical protein
LRPIWERHKAALLAIAFLGLAWRTEITITSMVIIIGADSYLYIIDFAFNIGKLTACQSHKQYKR